ncbi:histamine H3 receptor-like [Diadema setosum]|uniref:histamine H3 receptor-like n=1 Tax=Diadema setosum TaxID=31175 RepID=UPI003B3BB7F6
MEGSSAFSDTLGTTVNTSTEDSNLSNTVRPTTIGYGIFIVIIIAGNLLVLLSYYRDKELQKRGANVIIFNLAIADLLVGVFSLTINLSRIVSGQWLFGEVVCKLFCMGDYVLVNFSGAMIVFISLDRYWLVTKHIKYRVFMSRRRVRLAIGLIWTGIASFWCLVVFGWPIFGVSESDVDYSRDCFLPYLDDPSATVSTSALMCLIPYAGVVVLNVLIFANIRKQMALFNRYKITHSSQSRQANHEPSCTVGAEGHKEDCNSRTVCASTKGEATNDQQPKVFTISQTTVCTGRDDTNLGTAQSGARLRSSIKLASRLALLVAVFGACLLPYELLSIVNAFCSNGCVDQLAWDVAENILWANSAINPVLYALTDPRFRRNVKELLKCQHKGRTISKTFLTM